MTQGSNSISSRLSEKFAYYSRVLKAAFSITDRSRWSKNAREDPLWDGRNLLIAKHLLPNWRILDLGAGAQTLRKHAPLGCLYVPCDIVQSSPDCIVCDFNKGLYPKVDKAYDITICSGVLEYLREPLVFLQTIRSYSKLFILSYEPSTGAPSERMERLSHGFVNSLTSEELESLFREAGFTFELTDRWQKQVIYRLNIGA